MDKPTQRIAYWLRRFADRIDYAGAPKATAWSFTFEDREGILFRQDGKGCRLWYLGNDDYERAHTDGTQGTTRLPSGPNPPVAVA